MGAPYTARVKKVGPRWLSLALDTFRERPLSHPELRLLLVMLQTVALALETSQGASFPREDQIAIASLL
jgi:hypothetical protein